MILTPEEMLIVKKALKIYIREMDLSDLPTKEVQQSFELYEKILEACNVGFNK